jgi:hypothetical protein
MKECRVCGDVKPVTEYNKDSKTKDGYRTDCRNCSKKKDRKYAAKNREAAKLRAKKWHYKNKKRANENSKRWRQENPERLKELSKRWHEENKERVKELNRAWKKANKHKVNANTRMRQAAKLNATPPWLNEDHKFMLEEIYELRDLRTQATGVVHHVDHIVPLRGAKVCGLHVPWNLQVIPASANIRKGNSYGNHVHPDY